MVWNQCLFNKIGQLGYPYILCFLLIFLCPLLFSTCPDVIITTGTARRTQFNRTKAFTTIYVMSSTCQRKKTLTIGLSQKEGKRRRPIETSGHPPQLSAREGRKCPSSKHRIAQSQRAAGRSGILPCNVQPSLSVIATHLHHSLPLFSPLAASGRCHPLTPSSASRPLFHAVEVTELNPHGIPKIRPQVVLSLPPPPVWEFQANLIWLSGGSTRICYSNCWIFLFSSTGKWSSRFFYHKFSMQDAVLGMIHCVHVDGIFCCTASFYVVTLDKSADNLSQWPGNQQCCIGFHPHNKETQDDERKRR